MPFYLSTQTTIGKPHWGRTHPGDWHNWHGIGAIISKDGHILDGHHRFDVARCLHLSKVPAIMLNYLTDDRISVAVWPGRELESISKQDIVDMALSEELFPPKTSKHTIGGDLPPIFTTLEELA